MMKQVRIAIKSQKNVQMELMKKNVKKLSFMMKDIIQWIIKTNVFGKVQAV